MYTQEKSTTISFFRHNKRAKENFDIYRLEYPKTGQAADYRHRFLDANSRHYDYNLQGKFFWKHLQTEQANGQLTSGYAFSQKEDSEDNPLYRLDWLGGEWADGDMERLNLLPSAREELLRCMDMATAISLPHVPHATASLWTISMTGNCPKWVGLK